VVGSLPAPGAPAPTDANAQVALGAPGGSNIDISRIEGQVRDSSVKKIGEVVNSHPEEALAIIRTWLHQPV
jgi:flagellar M-ring protein FliF